MFKTQSLSYKFCSPCYLYYCACFILSEFQFFQGAGKEKPKGYCTYLIESQDSSELFQRINFQSAKPEVTLQNLKLILPFDLGNEIEASTLNRVLNCPQLQMNISEEFYKQYTYYIDSVEQYIPHTGQLLKLPMAIRFSYLQNNELLHMYC